MSSPKCPSALLPARVTARQMLLEVQVEWRKLFNLHFHPQLSLNVYTLK